MSFTYSGIGVLVRTNSRSTCVLQHCPELYSALFIFCCSVYAVACWLVATLSRRDPFLLIQNDMQVLCISVKKTCWPASHPSWAPDTVTLLGNPLQTEISNPGLKYSDWCCQSGLKVFFFFFFYCLLLLAYCPNPIERTYSTTIWYHRLNEHTQQQNHT